ncbi:hypothetical protein T4C_5999 [Trichinella pseudospiralis]|uniref:Uncharacterized protein n=1 Tax=Trichinella pseudospiralis TaxID=6337 RepID=A0A0V1HEU6_TRIPS|nr:hypothetical protein T4C_5999 [Trichinella pseudospiralis]
MNNLKQLGNCVSQGSAPQHQVGPTWANDWLGG